MDLDALEAVGPTYDEVGATRDGPLPAGYHHLRYRARLGAGHDVFVAAADALIRWRMHEAVGAAVSASSAEAAVGVTVVTRPRLGPVQLTAPCRVVWAVREPARAGFRYGTLPTHPAKGEEAFLLELAPDGAVWWTVTAFSRSAGWFMRAGGPVTRFLQRWFARRYATALARLAAAPRVP